MQTKQETAAVLPFAVIDQFIQEAGGTARHSVAKQVFKLGEAGLRYLSPMKRNPVCQSVLPWLAANLGKRCLAPLTSTDARALDAAVHIAELYGCTREPEVAKAFGLVVGRMQGSTKELAFHAIAHPLDWPDRPRLWAAAGLLPIPVRKCAYEPGGEGERAAR